MDDIDTIIGRYVEKWSPTMIRIWQEKISYYKVMDTGRLHESFDSQITNREQGISLVIHFLKYGIYQAHGSGYGYKKKYVNPDGRGVYASNGGSDVNQGDLKFLDDNYREEHRLNTPRRVGPAWGGKMTSGYPRNKRDWFDPKLYMSVMNLKEDLARLTGEQAGRVICEALANQDAMFTS